MTFTVTDCDYRLNWEYSYTLKYPALRRSTSDIALALFHAKMEGTPLHHIVKFATYDMTIVEPDEQDGHPCDCHECKPRGNTRQSN